jgi:hypothetical protein
MGTNGACVPQLNAKGKLSAFEPLYCAYAAPLCSVDTCYTNLAFLLVIPATLTL